MSSRHEAMASWHSVRNDRSVASGTRVASWCSATLVSATTPAATGSRRPTAVGSVSICTTCTWPGWGRCLV